MFTHRHRPVRRAFTLIELLIVIMILLALGGVVLVGYLNVSERADKDIQSVQFDQIDAALTRFKLDLKRWPTEEEGLAVLWDKEAIEDEELMTRWHGPYLEEKVDADKWGNELIYRFPGELRGEAYYDLISLGPDGEEGTADDMTNHDRLKNADGEIDQDSTFTPADTGG